MDWLITIGIFLLIGYIWNNSFGSHQILIQPYGVPKIPKLLLELAGIKLTKEVSWGNLPKAESKKFEKVYDKLSNASSVMLTFLHSQGVVNVQTKDKSYFIPTSGNETLVHERLGTFTDGFIDFIIYRKKNNWFKSPVIVGYLKKIYDFKVKNEKKESEIVTLFEFPESLGKRPLFTNNMIKEYKLEKKEDYWPEKDDFGDYKDSFPIKYKQDNGSGVSFNFTV